jgi:peptide/nickel transport system substrate-binding protein
MAPSHLRIVMGGMKDDVQLGHDPLRNAGRNAIGSSIWGVGEALTRVSRQATVVPWLAQRVDNEDPLTWVVRLRANARFWNGTPVTAEAVGSSFAQSLERQTDVGVVIDSGSRVKVRDKHTLEFITPRPLGNFPSALAHPQLIVHAADGALTTGPYHATTFEPDRRMELRRSRHHWAGLPRFERISISVSADLDAQIDALESGEADVIYAYPPEHIDRLEQLRWGYDVFSTPSMRALSIQINTGRPPFNDLSVREATALAIDRSELVSKVLRHHGAVATSILPPWADNAKALQSTDVGKATRLLEAAGWTQGTDGIRRKGPQRLAFTMFTPRGEVLAMAALARALRDQLAPLGYAIEVQEVAALSAAIKDGAYVSALRTSYAQLSGDPYFWLSLWLKTGGRVNQGPTYTNPDFDAKLNAYRMAISAQEKQDCWNDVEAILKDDVPHIFLVWAPLIVVARKHVLNGYTPDPNNHYFVDAGVA